MDDQHRRQLDDINAMRKGMTDLWMTDQDGNQIVECGQYAYVWPKYYPPLVEGERVLVEGEPDAAGLTWTTVTAIGTKLGGAVGFVRGRGGK